MKAALVLEDAEVPFWHNLNALRNFLPEGWRVKSEYPDLAELAVWAVEARYPGEWPEASLDDARRAVVEARGVVDCIVRDFVRRGVAVGPD